MQTHKLHNNPLVITSKYGWRTINGKRQWHSGIDLRLEQGSPVYSPEAGRVTAIYYDRNKSRIVEIKTPRGAYFQFVHLSMVYVFKGQSVVAGTQIGLSGGTPGTDGAGFSTAPHLHFGIFRKTLGFKKSQDPEGYVRWLWGQKPVVGSKPPIKPPVNKPKPPAPKARYTFVKPGEGLLAIAKRVKLAKPADVGTWAEIAKLNGSTNWKRFNDSLKPGQKIRVK